MDVIYLSGAVFAFKLNAKGGNVAEDPMKQDFRVYIFAIGTVT
jgi:hypothetical protein